MTNNPYALGTMGVGCPVFRWPAHIAPCMTDKEVDSHEHDTVCILCHDYVGRDWVDDVIVCLWDNGLKARIHRFHKLHEELERKLEEVHIANDRIADIYLGPQLGDLELLQCSDLPLLLTLS